MNVTAIDDEVGGNDLQGVLGEPSPSPRATRLYSVATSEVTVISSPTSL